MADDKGQSSKISKPKARKASAAKSPPPRESKPRSAPVPASKPAAAKSAAPAKKPTPPSPSRTKSARSQAAAPLLARAEKKISTTEKPARAPAQAAKVHAAKPAPKACYQPKTEPPQAPVAAAIRPSVPRPPAMFDMLGFARPWMNLGWRMTATGLSVQARIARAALEMPPAATAMRQGTKAMNAWLSLLQGRPPKTDEK